jgi:hypothetical protein
MAVNPWKISTLVLSGALALVVGRGAAVQAISACEGALQPTAEEQTRIRLARAAGFLERAEQELEAAKLARPKARKRALELLAEVEDLVERAQPPRDEEEVRPRPRPFTKGGTQASLVDPFATPPETRPTVAAAPAQVNVLDPWSNGAAIRRR